MKTHKINAPPISYAILATVLSVMCLPIGAENVVGFYDRMFPTNSNHGFFDETPIMAYLILFAVPVASIIITVILWTLYFRRRRAYMAGLTY